MTPRPTSEMEKLKNQPVTIWVLVLLVVGAATLNGFSGSHRTYVKETAQEELRHHCDTELVKVHPGIGRYATKEHLERNLSPINQKLGGIESSQKAIQSTLRRMERRRHR